MLSEHASAGASQLRFMLIVAAVLFAMEAGLTLIQHVNNLIIPQAIWLHLTLSGLGFICLIWGLIELFRAPLSSSPPAGVCFTRLPQPAIVVNRQGIICDLNQAAADWLKQSPHSLIRQPVHELFHPPHTRKEDCLLCRHIASGRELAATDFAFPQQHWQQVSLRNLATNDSHFLLQLHFDITAHKQIERQMELVIDGAELGYWDWDYVSGKHLVNQRWLDMLGLQANELDNFISDWDNRIHPDDHDRVRDLIAKHVQSGTPYVVEFRMRHKLGHWIWIQGSGSVVERDPVSGQPTRLCGIHQNISPRKQYEKNLQAAYQVINQSPSVVLKWQSVEGLPIEFATDNALKVFGYSSEQLMTDKRSYLDLIHPDDVCTYREELLICHDNQACKEIAHQPYRIIARHGSIKWIQDNKVVSRNESGLVTGYQGLITDITRQRQQNSAIRNIISSALQKDADSTLDNLSRLAAETLTADYTFIGEISPDGNCKTLSFCALHKTDDIQTYQMHASVCDELSTGKICCHNQQVFNYFTEDPWLQEHNIQGFIGIPLLSEQQRVYGYVVALYRQSIPDPQFAGVILKLFAAQITAELQRSRAMQALEVQKQRLTDAQSISHIGDWQWQWSDNLFSWSDEMYRISGYHRGSFVPSFANFLTQLVHPDDRNIFKNSLQNARNGDDIDFKHRIVLSNGEIRHVYQRGKVIRDEAGRAIGIQGTMQDITKRLKSERHLLEAKQEAEKATQVKSEFLANMSHEIRTPMNAIVGLVELCLNSNLNSKQRDYLERVEIAAHGLMNLIDDILDFSKMESGKLHLEAVPFLLEEMLDQVFSTMSELCNRKQLKLIRPQIDQDHHFVIGDPQRLRQILINLIGNAIKFTAQGQIEITLTEINRTNEQTTLQFCITDTGIGMSAEQQSRLFKAFSQGDSSVTRIYGGTGLGLVISKQLVEQMGGSISVSSQEHIGSSFTFTVNLGVTDINNTRQSYPFQRQDIDTRQLQYIRNARILLVEDNEVNRIVAIEILNQAHFKVDTAEHGEIALAKLKQNTYDCVLMDVQMPVMDGYQATRQLRQLPNCATLPVIAMTANVMSADRSRCLQAGMDDFIGKPILPSTLYSILIKWIKPHPSNQTNPPTNLISSPNEIPYLYGIDNNIGLMHTAGDTSVYRKILQKFALNHAHSINEIAKAVSEKNQLAARQGVHTLKGLAGSLGAIALQGHLIRLEECLAAQDSNVENTPSLGKLIASTGQELDRIINSIQSTLPVLAPIFDNKSAFSVAETQQQLQVLLTKLQDFDSDADQQLELILSKISDEALIKALLLIRKQIANYEFVNAAQALTQLLDFSDK